MKGKLLSVEEVRRLKDGTKVWIEKLPSLEKDYNQVNKVYTVEGMWFHCSDEIESKYSKIWLDGHAVNQERVKVYEWIDSVPVTYNVQKTYKNSEAIAMLENNPNIKFECPGGYKLFIRDGKIVIENENDPDGWYGFYLDDKWVLVQEPVTFMEAANSNKRIKYESWRNFVDVKVALEMLTLSDVKSLKDIINGRWYIEN
jgi:hypothetical protein